MNKNDVIGAEAPPPKAAVCVIGNEILTGKVRIATGERTTHDTNSHFITQFLFERGVDVVRIVVIPDEMNTIASTVKELSDFVGPSGYVFTTGGIGPTHDDITYESVAQAFGVGLELHEPTLEKFRAALKKFNNRVELNNERKRMAMLPVGSKILETGTWVPLVVVHNVYVLPGIPALVKAMLRFNRNHFVGVSIHRVTVYTQHYEGDIAKILKHAQKNHPTVAIGCYMNLMHPKKKKDHMPPQKTYKTRITIEGRDSEEVELVAQQLTQSVGGFRMEAKNSSSRSKFSLLEFLISTPKMIHMTNLLRRRSMLRTAEAAVIRQRFSTTNAAAPPRAAVCVIGNEVLTGKTQDTNSHFIAQFMFRRGVDLTRIVVIPDEMDVIASTVKELSDHVGPSGYVITTGGIGPTHDDITYEGVAQAFGLGVEMHQPTLDGLRAYLEKSNRGGELNEDRKRMAMFPAGCKTLSTASWVPIAVVHNVYVLPGIPSMVRAMLTHNEDHFVGIPIHRAVVHTLSLEGDIANPLTAVQKNHPNVAIGSYLNLTRMSDNVDPTKGVPEEVYNTCLTIEGRNAEEVEQVAEELVKISDGYRFVG